MRRLLFAAGNACAAAALLLIVIDPTQDLWPIFTLAGVGGVLAWAGARFFGPKRK
jgi:hypothetical protein